MKTRLNTKVRSSEPLQTKRSKKTFSKTKTNNLVVLPEPASLDSLEFISTQSHLVLDETYNPDILARIEIEVLEESPRVFLVKNFLTDAECDHLVAMARQNLKRSTTVDPETGDLVQIRERTSYGTFLERRKDEVLTNIEERIALLIDAPVENGERMQILCYGLGQEYKPHYDYFEPGFQGSDKHLMMGGQRELTLLMYLNDVEEGGETVFPKTGLAIKPIKGQAVMFCNCLPDGTEDPMSLHGSLPVITGEKWVATKWVREFSYIPD